MIGLLILYVYTVHPLLLSTVGVEDDQILVETSKQPMMQKMWMHRPFLFDPNRQRLLMWRSRNLQIINYNLFDEGKMYAMWIA